MKLRNGQTTFKRGPRHDFFYLGAGPYDGKHTGKGTLYTQDDDYEITSLSTSMTRINDFANKDPQVISQGKRKGVLLTPSQLNDLLEKTLIYRPNSGFISRPFCQL